MDLHRILMAEDEADIATVAKMALEAVGGFTVEVCPSGTQVLEKFPLFKPDLVMLDVMMPGMDGPATLASLRELPDGKDCPVVFMTAKVLPAEIEHLKALGALGVIAKPFDPMTLSATLRDIWNRRLTS